MLVRDSEVVERLRVLRIDLHRPFPPVNRLAPQPALCDRDAELHLLFGVGTCVSRQRCRRRSEQQKNRQGTNRHPSSVSIYANAPVPPSPKSSGFPAVAPNALPDPASPKRAARRRVEQGMCHAKRRKNVDFDGNLPGAASTAFNACPLFRNRSNNNGRAIIA